jgi:hypothetical protein
MLEHFLWDIVDAFIKERKPYHQTMRYEILVYPVTAEPNFAANQ